ncbi:MAG: isoprenyl transferase [Dysgonamonadaceae bacterium]|jgi:undecaprenyl diphosphate synthase|nr:isoprenyl transferase [Dysgonamonadaceae bacterium]
MSLREAIDLNRLPQHIAVIMDGNGRWAQQHGTHRIMGHREGVVSVRRVVEAIGRLGVKYVTLYTFSTENWNRPKEEVDSLMALMVAAIRGEVRDLMVNNVRLRAIGDLSRLSETTRTELEKGIRETSKNTGVELILALSYSARWEITEAVRGITREVLEGTIRPENIDERMIARHLTTGDIPDPDLLIRTGGEYRISNYLLWQLAYTELYFTGTFWPDFREEELYAAILDYQRRQRRFGKTGEQIKNKNNDLDRDSAC